MRKFSSVEELQAEVGKEVAVSDWLTMSQERVNQFAVATNSVERLVVSSAGTWSYKMTAGGNSIDLTNGTTTFQMYLENLYNGANIGLGTNHPLGVITNSAVVARFGAGGGLTILAPPTNTLPALVSTGAAHTPTVSVTFSATAMVINCALSNVFYTTFTANVTTAPSLTNPADGQTINWFITQDATGSRTMTWPTSFKWPSAAAGVLMPLLTLGIPTSATAASSVGAYALVADAGTYAADNYVFTGRMDGRLTVTPATLTLTAAAASREYGAADPAFAAAVTGFKNGETLASATSGAFVFASDATTASGVGQYRVDVSGLTAASGNYVFTQDVTNATALTVTPATLTVTAGNIAKTYDGQAFVGGSTQSYAGFRNDETAAVLAGSVSFAGTSQGAINAGTYAITPSGLSADNYIVSFASGTLTVNKAALTLTGDDATREYGAADPAFSATLTGFVNGEDFVTAGITGSAGGVSSALAGSPVGTYAYTPTAGTFAAANYAFTQFVDGRVTITPATLSVVAQAAAHDLFHLALVEVDARAEFRHESGRNGLRIRK